MSDGLVFTPGAPKRPYIRHDHGFLDDGNGNIDPNKRERPTSQDRANKEIWTAILHYGRQNRPHLHDALDAYEHFLIHNDGTRKECDYEGFVRDDPSGQTVLASLVEDTRTAALDYYDHKYPVRPKQARTDTFQMTSGVVIVGDGLAAIASGYPYPATENWQKAIGGHTVWADATFVVDTDPGARTRRFAIEMHAHVEDMYNFDPKKEDVATGTPDAINGRFEITGLGHEFLTWALLTRTITFSVPLAKLANNRAQPADQVVRPGGLGPPPPPP